MDDVGPTGVSALALRQANDAMAARRFNQAAEWFDAVPVGERPSEPLSACLVWMSRSCASTGNWLDALKTAERAVQASPSSDAQLHLQLLRKRAAYVSDHEWDVISEKVPRPRRLRADQFAPDMDSVHACGIYVSRGSQTPWSRYLRLGKGAYTDDEERAAVFSLASSYLARFVVEETDLLADVEVAVPVPANPSRYATRMVSLPHTLAAGLTRYLGLPNRQDALRWNPDSVDIEMKRLGRAERFARASDAFVPGAGIDRVRGTRVLVVDDLITSGATMRACAKLLRAHGASTVSGLGLAHTEG
jgi:Phosphoribosyl transferase domain